MKQSNKMRVMVLLLAAAAALLFLLTMWQAGAARAAPGEQPPDLVGGSEIVAGEEPVLVKDIHTTSYGAYPTEPVLLDGIAYFGVGSGEFWRSDGTEEATQLLWDFGGEPYMGSGWGPQELTVMNGQLFFRAGEDAELWRSDGTESGTVLVKDIYPGPGGSYPRHLTPVDGTLYFVAYDPLGGGQALWKSDGTDAGTVRVRALEETRALSPGPGFLYLVIDSYLGAQLWRSDGTEAGTMLLKQFSNAAPAGMTLLDGILYFSAGETDSGRELWRSDGTAAGTFLVKDIWPGEMFPGEAQSSSPANLVTMGGLLYFSASDDTHYNALWRSDGTEAGTYLVADLQVLFPYYQGRPALAVMDNTLYFPANDIDEPDPALWRSDGTPEGTTIVANIGLYGFYEEEYAYLTAGDSVLYFSGWNDGHGQELWRSDGTAAGTYLVKDIYEGEDYYQPASSAPAGLVTVGNRVYFSAEDGLHGRELWHSDGTEAGTTLVRDINAKTFDSNPQALTVVNGSLYLQARDGVHGQELWRSDGTITGTSLVKDIWPGPECGHHQGCPWPVMVEDGGGLYLAADDGIHGVELWRSDGTEAGTTLVKDIWPGYGSGLESYYGPSQIIGVEDVIFLAAVDGVHGKELWRSDGTEAGTYLVKDIQPGWDGSQLLLGAAVDGVLYFVASDGTHGQELWRSDGTEAGTYLVKNIHPNYSSMNQSQFAVMDSILYFVADDGGHGGELWRSDGTEAGTYLVRDIHPSGSGLDPYGPENRLVVVADILFFVADDGTHGPELWRTDGTEAGTEMVKEIIPDYWQRPQELTAVGGLLYFTADDAIHGMELWRSDGTEAGTHMVKDINLGNIYNYGSAPVELTEVGGYLFFSADDEQHGRELWQSDGTEAGTQLVADINPGSASSLPRSITEGQGRFFFVADDGSHGQELWQAAVPPPLPVTAASVNSGPSVAGIGITYTFRATAGPLTATLPLTFTWQATGQAPVSHVVDAFTDEMAFSWPLTGTKTVTVTAGNSAGSHMATHTLLVVEGTIVEVAPGEATTIVAGLPGLTTTLSLPVGSVSETTTLVYRSLEEVGETGNLLFAGRAFELAAYRSGTALPSLSFAEPVTVTVAYSDEAVSEIDREQLRLFLWQEGEWTAGASCLADNEQLVDVGKNQLSGVICQTGRFALLGPAAVQRLFLPLVGR